MQSIISTDNSSPHRGTETIRLHTNNRNSARVISWFCVSKKILQILFSIPSFFISPVDCIWSLQTDDVLAGFYVKEDGRANPVDCTMSMAKGARMRTHIEMNEISVGLSHTVPSLWHRWGCHSLYRLVASLWLSHAHACPRFLLFWRLKFSGNSPHAV
jgi:hypothetical protein